MRDQLPDRTRPRNLGAVDPRISNFVRKRSDSNLPLEVGTPLVWVDYDDLDMTSDAIQAGFTDRMGVSWAHPAAAGDGQRQQGAMNGRNAVLFANSIAGAIPITASSAITTAADVSVFLAYSTVTTSDTLVKVLVQKGTLNLEWTFYRQTSGGNDFIAWKYKNANNANEVSNLGTASTGRKHIIAGRGSAANADLYVDGVLGQATVPTAGLGSISSVIAIGGDPGAGTPATGANACVVAELIVYGSYLSDASRSAVERYLGRKYGVAVS